MSPEHPETVAGVTPASNEAENQRDGPLCEEDYCSNQTQFRDIWSGAPLGRADALLTVRQYKVRPFNCEQFLNPPSRTLPPTYYSYLYRTPSESSSREQDSSDYLLWFITHPRPTICRTAPSVSP